MSFLRNLQPEIIASQFASQAMRTQYSLSDIQETKETYK